MNNVARFIKAVKHGVVFRLDPPLLRHVEHGDPGELAQHEYIIVMVEHVPGSTTVITSVYSSDELGQVQSWEALDVAMRFDSNHADALKAAGYEVLT